MYVVAIGWMYVVLMAALAEAVSPQGSLLGALMTFIGWGLLPCALVLYILGTPARKRRLRALEAQRAPATHVEAPTGPGAAPPQPQPLPEPETSHHTKD